VRIRYIAASLIIIALASWLSVIVIGLIRGKVSKCPRCFSKGIRPSWPRLLDKTLPRCIIPYRCDPCKNRFYARRSDALIVGSWPK
jgi:hypothetical protein